MIDLFKKPIKKIRYCYHKYIVVFLVAFFYSFFGYVTLCGFYGIGDTCYELSFIDEYKKVVKKKIRVITTKNRINIFSFYEAVDKVSIINMKVENMILYIEKKQLFLNKYSFLKDVAHYKIHYCNDNMIEKMRCFYGIKKGSKLSFPKTRSNSICEYNFKNSILIIPESNFYKSMYINNFLIDLIKILKKNGYTIFINGDSLKELEDNVIHIFLDLNTLLVSSCEFDCIIGIRTGLLDFLVNTKSTIYCLYGDDEIGRWLKKSFSLSFWNANSDVSEYLLSQNVNTDEIIGLICSRIK